MNDYSDEDRALFARYRDQRAICRPTECNYVGDLCWVEHGPVAMPNHTRHCRGCGGAPKGFARPIGKYPRVGR